MYHVTDKPPAKGSKDWERVAAVVTHGAKWQFKDFPFKVGVITAVAPFKVGVITAVAPFKVGMITAVAPSWPPGGCLGAGLGPLT